VVTRNVMGYLFWPLAWLALFCVHTFTYLSKETVSFGPMMTHNINMARLRGQSDRTGRPQPRYAK
jgi:hypothetical protein